MPAMQPTGQDADLASLVRGNTRFALDFYAQIRHVEGNLICSPYSISTALAMTYAGARGNTEAQMAQTLHFALDQERLHPACAALQGVLRAVQDQGHVQLCVANSLWPHDGYPFLDAYLSLVKRTYGVSISPVDYANETEAARLAINAWVKEKTGSKIDELIKQGVLNTLTRLVLANAIYFKGDWASQFDVADTRDAPFWVTRDHQVDVPMMAQRGRFGYTEADGLQVLVLPYLGDDLSMVVFLPAEKDGLATLEGRLSAESLARWTDRLVECEVQVHLPRFRFRFGDDLVSVLVAMGMADACDRDRADFSGMDGIVHWLSIGAVIHEAVIEVNEEGSEAAAATAVVMQSRGRPPPLPVFCADHPFLFMIRENATGSVLFLGRATDPSRKELER